MTEEQIAEYLASEVINWNGLQLVTVMIASDESWSGATSVVSRQWRYNRGDKIVEVTLKNDGNCQAFIRYKDTVAECDTSDMGSGEVADIVRAVLDRTLDLWREYMRAWEV